jgi:hypothetical protein
MACCGQNREALKQVASPTRTIYPHLEDRRRARSTAAAASQTLRLVNAERIVVHGPRTGWKYEFTPERPAQAVAASDAEWLIATGLFRRT